MTSWLLSIVGIVFLSVLIDLIYPNGKTNSFCKTIFGIFAVIVMISPILKFDFNTIRNSNEIIDAELTNNIMNAKNEYYKLKIEDILKTNNIEGVSVEIESNLEDNVFEIENIYVDTTNIVLTNDLTHTNKYEVILQKIINAINIDSERIIIYG